eukprot:6110461-Prymnesium_polylepis.1
MQWKFSARLAQHETSETRKEERRKPRKILEPARRVLPHGARTQRVLYCTKLTTVAPQHANERVSTVSRPRHAHVEPMMSPCIP